MAAHRRAAASQALDLNTTAAPTGARGADKAVRNVANNRQSRIGNQAIQEQIGAEAKGGDGEGGKGARPAPPSAPADPGDICRDEGRRARAGFPFQSRMESAFGKSFADVRAVLRADAALDLLGAEAATDGHILLLRAAPRVEGVAHDLAHVA